jgi:hypothetical protein
MGAFDSGAFFCTNISGRPWRNSRITSDGITKEIDLGLSLALWKIGASYDLEN